MSKIEDAVKELNYAMNRMVDLNVARCDANMHIKLAYCILRDLLAAKPKPVKLRVVKPYDFGDVDDHTQAPIPDERYEDEVKRTLAEHAQDYSYTHPSYEKGKPK